MKRKDTYKTWADIPFDPLSKYSIDKAKQEIGKPKHATVHEKSLCSSLATPIVFLLLGLAPVYYFYGLHFFYPMSWKMLSYSSQEWNSALHDKTILLLGGHHRAGTTLLWKMLKLHPTIGAFGSTYEMGSGFSEGVFLQDVTPQFGIGYEGLPSATDNTVNTNKGLGQYALAPEELVHWTEENHLSAVTHANRDRLLNQWGYYWNGSGRGLQSKILIEKSPTNAVVSRYLQALFDIGLVSTEKRESRTQFIFMVRHPLANSYSHKVRFTGCTRLEIDTLVANWLRIMEYIHKDTAEGHLKRAVVLRLEDLTANPKGVYTKVLQFLGLDVDEKLVARATEMVKTNINKKYARKFCYDVETEGGKERFDLLNKKYGKQVRQYGYDLEEYLDLCEELRQEEEEEERLEEIRKAERYKERGSGKSRKIKGTKYRSKSNVKDL